MVNWSCASALCFNNYQSKDANGQLLKYYHLPRSESIQKVYMKLFKTSGMNWGKGHICGAHWSKPRENATHLPDIIVPDDQYDKICEKHTLAKKTFESYKNPNDKLKLRYKTAKRRFKVATEIKNTVPEKQQNPIERDASVPIVLKRRELSKNQYKIRLNSALSEMNDLKKELQEANDKIKQLQK